MEGKRPRGRPKFRWKDTVRRNGPLTGKDGKVSARPATPHRKTATKGEKGEKVVICVQFYYRLWILKIHKTAWKCFGQNEQGRTIHCYAMLCHSVDRRRWVEPFTALSINHEMILLPGAKLSVNTALAFRCKLAAWVSMALATVHNWLRANAIQLYKSCNIINT